MGDRIDNMGKMMNNPKQRNMYFIIVGIAVITLGAGIYISTKNTDGPQASVGASVAAAPSLDNVPGTSTNIEYNKSVEVANEREVKIALEEGKTFLPTLTNKDEITDVSPLDELDREKARLAQEKAQKEEEELNRLAIEKQREDEERARATATTSIPLGLPVQTVQQVPVKQDKYGYNDAMLIASLTGSWGVKAPKSERDFAGQSQMNTQQANNDSEVSQATNNTNTSSEQTKPFAKAGTIYNAVLETGINSDEPSPVLAKIVSGPLKGSRLIGSINTVGKKVVVQFSSINIPGVDTSTSISAYAVDSNTSRTALADDVDNHYFLKYGVLLASAFLGGYAEAISRQNTTTSVGPLGNTTVVQGEIPSSDINKQALGKVGQALSQSVGSDVQNIKPTITVNEGGAIGILLLSDLVIK